MAGNSERPIPFAIKLCSDKAAFEVRTGRKVFLNMDEVEKKLRSSKLHKIMLCTPHMIFLKSGTAETTLSRDGRLLIKKVQNENEAKRLAQEILQVIQE